MINTKKSGMEKERRVRGIELGSIGKGSSVVGLTENGTFERRLAENEIARFGASSPDRGL